jgi:hypothetical protein
MVLGDGIKPSSDSISQASLLDHTSLARADRLITGPIG